MLSKNKWLLKDFDEYAAEEISKALKIKYPTASLLCARGYSDAESAAHFLKKDCAVLYDPYLLKDMDKGVLRILSAVDNCEKITVYGDYDVDGITSVCNLYKYIKSIGGDVDYYIPNRGNEGYGLNTDAVMRLIENGTRLIITVDTGITAVDEVKFASQYGVDTVITDHHECSEVLPSAVAVIDPKRRDSEYPFKELAGVGVVFKIICACEQYLTTGKTYTDPDDMELNISAIIDVCKSYADLTAIGTIADVMPLADENRLIVSYGLDRLSLSKNTGLNALMAASGADTGMKKVTSSVISFTLAPRINAAGRMGSADIAVKLLLTENKEEAEEIAEILCQSNVQRQSEELHIMQEAEEIIRSENLDKNEKILVLHHDGWHHGVIGIVASKLTEKYNLPCILISFEDGISEGKGSGRSIDGFNLHTALSECSDSLERFGGHALAAGLTCSKEKLPEFRKKLQEYAKNNISEEDTVKKIEIDFEFREEDATLELAEELSRLEPYGASNPSPLFLMRDCTVTAVNSTATNKHSRITLERYGEQYRCMIFGKAPDELGFAEGDTTDIVFNLGVNEFRGTRSRQMIIRDIEFSRALCEDITSQYMLSEDIADKRIFPENKYIPDKADCTAVFRYLKDLSQLGNNRLLISTAVRKLRIEYVKILLIIKIFKDMGFIDCSYNSPIELSFDLIPQKEKKPLENNELFKWLSEMCTYSV